MRIQSQPPSGPRPHHAWATTPPLGWCSADGSSSATNEAFVRANAAFLAEHCVRLGWKYVVVGPDWYSDDNADADVNVDQWGRPLPAVSRFASAKRGAGFVELARHVHELGLRLGVHLSRGIPRSAVERQLPIKGTDVDAAHIMSPSRCSARDPKMLTIDTRKRGAQAYYDSVFELFAAWGVDYVELDDVTGSYEDYAAELEVIREAVDKAGRPLLLGVSPAAPVIDAAAHLRAYANLWQVGAGVWNDWDAIRRQFAEVGRWREHAEPGWPRPGLLPLETAGPGCQLNSEELRSFVSLCCIARAPLFVTGDLCSLDATTVALLTNPELLTLGRNAANSRLLYERKGIVAWIADVPNSEDKYIALFNTRDPRPLTPETRIFEGTLALGPRNALHTLEVELALPPADTLLLRVDSEAWPAPCAVWGEPRLLMEDGRELPLTDLPWTRAGARSGQVRVCGEAGAEPVVVAGDELQDGFVAPAPCVLEFRLPAGVKGFSAVCGTEGEAYSGDASSPAQRPLSFSVHAFLSDSGSPKPSLPITITKAELGLAGPMWVRDLWQREELGLFPSEFSAQIAWHGCGIYRVSEGG